MALAVDFEAQRLANLEQKRKLLAELNLDANTKRKDTRTSSKVVVPPSKKRRGNSSTTTEHSIPLRSSARIAASGSRVSYSEENHPEEIEGRRSRTMKPSGRQARRSPSAGQPQPPMPSKTLSLSPSIPRDLTSLIIHYNNWTADAPPGIFDEKNNAYSFAGHPDFKPNKSPLSILLEGAFGGSYFSPWYSRTLSLTLENDHFTTLPPDWLEKLQPPEKYLTSPQYRPDLNRHGVQCGQTLSQWEDAGWINFEHDARGWFEWYIRFWLGRRLDDGEDERQIGRWARCVGPKGRWKRMLLKKYVEMGVRSVFDDEEDDEEQEEEERKVSPVMHQTCLHWAYQVTQADLDEAWRERSGRGS